MEPFDVDDERRSDVRRLEKESDWKREVLIFADLDIELEKLKALREVIEGWGKLMIDGSSRDDQKQFLVSIVKEVRSRFEMNEVVV